MLNVLSWVPHNLFHCLDSNFLGIIIGVLCFFIIIGYIKISKIWYESSKESDDKSKKLWFSLIWIFLLCAMSGYGTIILSIWFPKFSAIIKLISLTGLLISLFCFLRSSSCKHFAVISDDNKIANAVKKNVTGSTDQIIEKIDKILKEKGIH